MLATLTSLFFSLVLGTTAHAQSAHAIALAESAAIPLSLWQPEIGDSFIADTEENVGYLVHPDGSFTRFEIVTGQKRVVRYIGRTYHAATPSRIWRVSSTHIKGDRLTYGVTGRFLRLYDENEETPYGIHGYGREDEMFSFDTRFKSMGCIIVRENHLNIIERTYHLNGDKLDVITTHGLRELPKHIAAAETEEKS